MCDLGITQATRLCLMNTTVAIVCLSSSLVTIKQTKRTTRIGVEGPMWRQLTILLWNRLSGRHPRWRRHQWVTSQRRLSKVITLVWRRRRSPVDVDPGQKLILITIRPGVGWNVNPFVGRERHGPIGWNKRSKMTWIVFKWETRFLSLSIFQLGCLSKCRYLTNRSTPSGGWNGIREIWPTDKLSFFFCLNYSWTLISCSRVGGRVRREESCASFVQIDM